MTTINPNVYLRGIARGAGIYARGRRKFVANKERNWLTALSLNAFARSSLNKPLNDLDELILNAFVRNQFSQDAIQDLGKAYSEMPIADRQVLFPAAFAKLDVQSTYTLARLKSDLPKLERATLKMSNVSDIDIHSVHARTARLREFAVPNEVIREFGGGMIRAVAPNTTPPNPNYTIKAVGFRCLEESSEWSASDEVYWLFGTTAKGANVTSRSHVFNDVDATEAFNFNSDEGTMWGPAGIPQDFPDGEIGCVVSLIEHDEGDPSEVKDGFAAAFAIGGAILVASGAGAPVAAVVAAIGGFVQFLIGFLADDHIADNTFVFTRQAVVDHLGKPTKPATKQSFDITRLFTDSDARYKLRLRVTRKT